MRSAERQNLKGKTNGSIADYTAEFLELCPFPLAIWDETRRKCLFNPPSYRLLGFPEAELDNKPQLWNSQVHSADLVSWHAQQARVAVEKCQVTCDYRFHRKNGAAPIWLRETIVPLHQPNSSWKFLSTYIDISDLKGKLQVPTQPAGASANSDALRGLFHEVNNKLQRLSMEIELAGIEGNIESALSRKFADALAGVNQGLNAIHEQCVGPKSSHRSGVDRR